MKKSIFSFLSSINDSIKSLSMPAANPTAGVDGPPMLSTKLSYLPPPSNAFCDFDDIFEISNVVPL